MTAGPSANGNNVTSPVKEAPDPDNLSKARASLTGLGKQLKRVGAAGAADRITRVAEMGIDDVRTTTFEDLVRDIDPERVIDERADACGRLRKKDSGDTRGFFSRLWSLRRSVRLTHWARNTAALLPLIFTWSALGWAALEYELDLHTVKGDSGKPFLLLWQQGFTDHFLPFGWVATIDAMFLLGVVALTWWIHRVERSAEEFETSVWDTVGELEEAMRHGTSRTPATAEDWAREINRIINRAFHQTENLAEESKKVLREASTQFASTQAQTQELIRDHQALVQGMQADGRTLIQELQDRNQAVIQGMQADSRTLIQQLQEGNQEFLAEFQRRTQETISQFSAEVLRTLVSVREQNEIFIENTRRTNERVLDDLVQRQIRPLLTHMEDLLGQFRTQQEAYSTTVAGLTESVTAIQKSAARLADNSQEFTGSTRSIAESLQAMASSQERFADQVQESAVSMTTAAASMTEVKDTLKAVLVDSTQEMTGNITRASASLAQTQASLAQTQDGLAATTEALQDAAASFRKADARPAPPPTDVPQVIPAAISQLPAAIASLTAAINKLEHASTPHRHWWQGRRRSEYRPDGLEGQ